MGLDDGQDYGLDALRDDLAIDSPIGSDLRAVLDCLDQVRNKSDVQDRVVSTGPLVGPELELFTDLIGRGLDEMKRLIRDKASVEIRSSAGIR